MLSYKENDKDENETEVFNLITLISSLAVSPSIRSKLIEPKDGSIFVIKTF